MRKLFILLILLVFISPVYGATIYKWVDKEGVVNYTDDYNKVPSKYRDRVNVLEFFTEKAPSVQTQQIGPMVKEEETTTDIYGRGEVWWRDKVHLWKEKLREATENHEKSQRNFTKKSEELSQTNFYGRSRSQTKWDVMELNQLNEEKKKYEAQMAAANEMLEKLSKEAKEAKADPSWLE